MQELSYRIFFFLESAEGIAEVQRCRGSVRKGRQELPWTFRECRGEFQGRKELLMFRQEGQKEVVGAFFQGGQRDSISEGRKRSCRGFCQDSGVLRLKGKPTRKKARIRVSFPR